MSNKKRFQHVFTLDELIALRTEEIKKANGDVQTIMEINQEFMTVKASLQRDDLPDIEIHNRLELSPIDFSIRTEINPHKVGASFENGILKIYHPSFMYGIPATDEKDLPQVSNSFTLCIEDSLPKFLIK